MVSFFLNILLVYSTYVMDALATNMAGQQSSKQVKILKEFIEKDLDAIFIQNSLQVSSHKSCKEWEILFVKKFPDFWFNHMMTHEATSVTFWSHNTWLIYQIIHILTICHVSGD